MPTENLKQGQKKVRGALAQFDTRRLREWLTVFAYEFDENASTVENVIWEAFKDWKKIERTTLGYHTKKSVAKGGTVTEYTRRAICRMLRAFASTEPDESEIRDLVKGITPDAFILRRESEELHALVAEYLKCLSKPYYGLPRRGWEVWEMLPRVLRCLRDIETHLRDASTDTERLRVATLACKWLEAAQLLRAVFTQRHAGCSQDRGESGAPG